MTIKVGGSYTCKKCGQWGDGSNVHICQGEAEVPLTEEETQLVIGAMPLQSLHSDAQLRAARLGAGLAALGMKSQWRVINKVVSQGETVTFNLDGYPYEIRPVPSTSISEQAQRAAKAIQAAIENDVRMGDDTNALAAIIEAEFTLDTEGLKDQNAHIDETH